MNKKQYEAKRTALMNEAQALINAGKAKEAEEKTKRETARNLIALNQMSVETIAKCVDLPVEEVRALAERKPA